jgi:hypothetical protein
VAASNEGPETDELSALYDRFLLRRVVTAVSDDGVIQVGARGYIVLYITPWWGRGEGELRSKGRKRGRGVRPDTEWGSGVGRAGCDRFSPLAHTHPHAARLLALPPTFTLTHNPTFLLPLLFV